MAEIRTQCIEPVMFICSETGEGVQTGHRMRATEFASTKGPRSFRCGQCGMIHTWTVDTAWLGIRARAA